MIYAVRHGSTDRDKEEVIRAEADFSLNNSGIAQAQNLRKRFFAENGREIDVCLCSPMARTEQTAQQIFDGKIIFDDRLLERRYGVMEGAHFDEIDYNGFWNFENEVQYQDAETIAELMERTNSLLNDIITSEYDKKNLLIVTHGSTLRALRANLLNENFNGDFRGLPLISNCELIALRPKKIHLAKPFITLKSPNYGLTQNLS